jgi:hypothetical protein
VGGLDLSLDLFHACRKRRGALRPERAGSTAFEQPRAQFALLGARQLRDFLGLIG